MILVDDVKKCYVGCQPMFAQSTGSNNKMFAVGCK